MTETSGTNYNGPNREQLLATLRQARADNRKMIDWLNAELAEAKAIERALARLVGDSATSTRSTRRSGRLSKGGANEAEPTHAERVLTALGREPRRAMNKAEIKIETEIWSRGVLDNALRRLVEEGRVVLDQATKTYGLPDHHQLE
jgi:hypothetical protein